MFLKMGSADVCQVFRETKMHNGGRILLAALNLCVELNLVWPLSTLTIPPLTARRQSAAASIQKLPHSAVRSVSTARHGSPCIRRIDLSEVSRRFLYM